MINLNGYDGFALDTNDHSIEANKLSYYAIVKDIKLERKSKRDKPDKNLVPCGGVEYIENILGYHPKPDYYPKWMSGNLHRKVWESDEWILGEKLFVKPSDMHKRFTGFTTKGTYSKKKKPPFWYSDIITFVDEWRYYVSSGKNIGGWWYQGSNEDKSAPSLNFNIPENFTGTIDMGIDSNNNFALVECHPPYACGWYGPGEDIESYLQWLVDGWIYMQKKHLTQ